MSAIGSRIVQEGQPLYTVMYIKDGKPRVIDYVYFNKKYAQEWLESSAERHEWESACVVEFEASLGDDW